MTDPNFSAAVARLRKAYANIDQNKEVRWIVSSKEEVLARFSPMLQPEAIPNLTEAELRPFLNFKDNKHWSGLHRQANHIFDDIGALRATLLSLVDETQPIRQRLDEFVSQNKIRGIGKGILTALLHVAYPQTYGVWNNASVSGLTALGIVPRYERGTSYGQKYELINSILNRLAAAVGVDLWTLDALWSLVQVEDADQTDTELSSISVGSPPVTSSDEAGRFGLERHLQDFLFDNWSNTSLGPDWTIYALNGEPDLGYEYVTPIGRIDILAKHKREPKWLVIELKRGRSSDRVVGQTLRYMGWVKRHLAEDGETVEGMIISLDAEPQLHYAIEAVPQISFMSYRVDFRLEDAPSPEAWERP